MRILFLIITVVLIGSLRTCDAVGQTTKYDRGGNLNSISGLLTDATGCESSKSFTGTVSNISNADSKAATGYEFTLRLAGNKQQRLYASVPNADGQLVIEFADLMVKGQRLVVRARACGSGGIWTAESMTKK